MQVRLLAPHLGRTLGGGGPQPGDRMLRRLTSRGCGPGESAANAPQEVGSGPGPGRRGGAGRECCDRSPGRRPFPCPRAAGWAEGCRLLALGPAPPPDPAPTAWRACGCGCAVNKASLPGRPLATEEEFACLVPPRTWAAVAEGSGPSGLLLPKVWPESPR